MSMPTTSRPRSKISAIVVPGTICPAGGSDDGDGVPGHIATSAGRGVSGGTTVPDPGIGCGKEVTASPGASGAETTHAEVASVTLSARAIPPRVRRIIGTP
ncbi:hypothetical protein TSST111916_12560 [Tsukamurella strandjordii]